MIDWREYKDKAQRDCLAGWIAGRPLYIIAPDDDYWTLLHCGYEDVYGLGTGTIEELKAMAEKHRLELTGGLFS